MPSTYEKILQFVDLKPIDVPMIAICAVLFVLLWRYLARVLFVPYLEVVESREAKTTGAVDTVRDIRTRCATLNQEIDSRLNEARVTAMQKKISALNKAKQESAKIVERAQAAADELLHKARLEQEQNIKQVRSELLQKVEALTTEVVQRAAQPLRPAATHKVLQVALFCGVTFLQFLAPALSIAAEDHGTGHEASGFSSLIPFIVNFSAYCVVLFIFVLRPQSIKFWASRVRSIREAVARSTGELTTAKAELRKVEARHASLGEQIESLSAKVAQETENEVLRVLEEARDQAEGIATQSKMMLESERRSREAQLRREVAEEVLSRARDKIQKDTTLENDRARREASVAGMPALAQEALEKGALQG